MKAPLMLAIARCLALFVAVLHLPAGAQDKPTKKANVLIFQEHEIGKLRNHIDKQVVVQGRVATTSASGSGHQFLNFPSKSVRIICFKDDVKNFPGGGPAKTYKGKSIALTGLLTLHKGNLQIQLKSPKQISIAGAKLQSSSGKSFVLKEESPGVFVTPAGLRYAGKDPEGRSRIDHVMRHAKDEPGRSGSHGVFDKGSQNDVLALIDEAWSIAQEKGIKPSREGRSVAYTIPMGRRIGYLGGKEGTRRRKPVLTRVFIVLRRGSHNVITAFPK